MRSTNWAGTLIVTAMVLAICELSYAHLRLDELWALPVLVLPVWRVVQTQFAGLTMHSALWLAPPALMLAGILMWLEESRNRRKTRAGMAKGESHE